jgi:hypothetical protein
LAANGGERPWFESNRFCVTTFGSTLIVAGEQLQDFQPKDVGHDDNG